jgi:hypothetical protein
VSPINSLYYRGETYSLPVRMIEVISEHLVVWIGGATAQRLHLKIEVALSDPDGRGVNVTTVEAPVLQAALSLMNPPEGFPDTPFRRLLAAVGGRVLQPA